MAGVSVGVIVVCVHRVKCVKMLMYGHAKA